MKKVAFLFLIASLLAAAASPAQEPVPSLVRTDLLIFRHVATPPEQVSDILSMPLHPGDAIQASVELSGSSTTAATTGDADGGRKIRLLTGKSKLSSELAKIEQSDHFELLHRVAWQQPAYDPQNALHVSLVPARRNGLLKGTAKLSFERYFQLAVTLLYEPGFADLEPSERDSPESDTVFIHLKEVMTDNKLYYLDHPLVGALVQITVLETVVPGETETDL